MDWSGTPGFPVLLTFDIDAETLWTARDPRNATRPVTLSQGVYGPKVGIPRILDLLRRHDIRCTFFVPGLVIERYRDVIASIVEAGHEIGHHSYSHKWLDDMPLEEERAEMEKGIAIIQEITGRRPRGYRSPAGEFSPHTMDLLLEYGFEYSSNFFDADAPYRHVVGGRKTDIVELPFAWVLDDAPFFLYSVRLPGRSMMAPSAVLEAWKAEFDGIYREGGAYVLAMHPQIIGRHSRLQMLDQLIQYIKRHPRVWFARCDEVASAARDRL